MTAVYSVVYKKKHVKMSNIAFLVFIQTEGWKYATSGEILYAFVAAAVFLSFLYFIMVSWSLE